MLRLAATHWSRFRGLMATDASRFPAGEGYGLSLSRSATLLPCASPSMCSTLMATESWSTWRESETWRVAPVRIRAASVLELPGHTLISTRTAIGDEDRDRSRGGHPLVTMLPNFWWSVLTRGANSSRIRPALGRSPQRLAGEAQTGLFPTGES